MDPREGGDPLALKPRFFPQRLGQMDSRLRGNDEGFEALAASCLDHAAPSRGRAAKMDLFTSILAPP